MRIIGVPLVGVGPHLAKREFPAKVRGTKGLRHPGLEPGPALARASHSTLYTGVASALVSRIHQHREGVVPGFTRRYGIKRLVWFEAHDTMETAILREKSIKRWPRAWKYDLIHSINPTWRDLAKDLGFAPLPLK